MTIESGDNKKGFSTAYKGLLLTMMASAFVIPLGFVAMPYLEFFNGMALQPKAKAQGMYGRNYGKELLIDAFLPVEGTIHRDYTGHPAQLSGNDEVTIQLAGAMLKNPMDPTLEVLQRGQKLFNIYCIVCHGQEGLGNGSVVGPGRFPAPASLHSNVVKVYRDGSIYQVITNGKNMMPGYADKLVPTDRWAVVHYVRALQRSLDPKPEDLQP